MKSIKYQVSGIKYLMSGFSICLALLVSTSCEKKEVFKKATKTNESQQIENNETSSPDYFDENYYNTSKLIFITDKLNKENKVEQFEFEGEKMFLSFLKGNAPSLFEEINTKIEKLTKARRYAYENNIVTEFDAHGTIKESYTQYLKDLFSNNDSNNSRGTRGVGILWDNLNASGSNRPLTGGPVPTYFGWNNKAESATGIGLANSVFDKNFFGGSSRYLLLGTGTVIPFDGIGFRNKTNSSL